MSFIVNIGPEYFLLFLILFLFRVHTSHRHFFYKSNIFNLKNYFIVVAVLSHTALKSSLLHHFRSQFKMVFMAAYEGPGPGLCLPNNNEVDDLSSSDEMEEIYETKAFYAVPMTFVIHTYSRVQPDSFSDSRLPSLSTFLPYRHKITMFKVAFVVWINFLVKVRSNLNVRLKHL